MLYTWLLDINSAKLVLPISERTCVPLTLGTNLRFDLPGEYVRAYPVTRIIDRSLSDHSWEFLNR